MQPRHDALRAARACHTDDGLRARPSRKNAKVCPSGSNNTTGARQPLSDLPQHRPTPRHGKAGLHPHAARVHTLDAGIQRRPTEVGKVGPQGGPLAGDTHTEARDESPSTITARPAPPERPIPEMTLGHAQGASSEVEANQKYAVKICPLVSQRTTPTLLRQRSQTRLLYKPEKEIEAHGCGEGKGAKVQANTRGTQRGNSLAETTDIKLG